MAKTAKGYGSEIRKPFWENIDKSSSGCWLWRGGKNRKGQGCVNYKGRVWNTSRLAWSLTFGSISEEKWVLHKCDTPSCINPNHLFLGTPTENVHDMISKGRSHFQNRLKLIPSCHPNRIYEAKGMCHQCYHRDYRSSHPRKAH